MYILGTGSIAWLLAHKLKQTGQQDLDPVLISRKHASPHKITHSYIAKDQRLEEDFTVLSADFLPETIDHLILCCKAYDAESAIIEIMQHVRSIHQITFIQNGLGYHQACTTATPNSLHYHCVLTEGAYLSKPDQLHHVGGANNYLGTIDQPSETDDLELTNHPLLSTDLHIETPNSIWPHVRQKFLINCVINPLTLIHQCKNGELIDNALIHSELIALCEEIDNFVKSYLDWHLPDLYLQARKVAEKTALNKSSTLQDFQSNRPTELNFLNAYLSELAQEHGTLLPQNQKIINMADDIIKR